MSFKHLPKAPLHPTDEAYLQAVFRYCYATAEHLLRRFHSSGALTSVQTRLKRLRDEVGVLQAAEAYPRRHQSGSAPLVYFVARRGLNYLEEELGVAVPERFRASEWRTVSESHARHSLGITDLLVASELLSEQVAGISLAGQFHERLLSSIFGREQQMVVDQSHMVPDALLVFLLRVSRAEAEAAPILCEYDRSTERQGVLREKIRSYIPWLRGPYREFMHQRFGIQAAPTIAFVTPGDQKRRDLLKQWTEAELTALGLAHSDFPRLFCFTSVDPAAVDPRAFFFSPTALQPFSETLAPLIES